MKFRPPKNAESFVLCTNFQNVQPNRSEMLNFKTMRTFCRINAIIFLEVRIFFKIHVSVRFGWTLWKFVHRTKDFAFLGTRNFILTRERIDFSFFVLFLEISLNQFYFNYKQNPKHKFRMCAIFVLRLSSLCNAYICFYNRRAQCCWQSVLGKREVSFDLFQPAIRRRFCW